MIRVVQGTNPFQPATHRIVLEANHAPGMMVADLLRAVTLPPERSTAVIDGKAIPSEMAEGFPVEDGGEVVVMPAVGGGGFLKTFAEIAVLAIAAVVTYGASLTLLGGFTLGFTGLGLTGATGALVAGAITLGGNLLINAFMGGGGGKGGPDTATYDPAEPKTIGSGGVPIPKGYGTMRWGGNLIASNVDAEGQDNYLNVLVSFGWGPATSISDIRINGTSIEDFKQVTYQVRLGSNDQTPIPYFNNIKNGYPQAIRCLAGEPVVVQGTGTNTQGLEITCQFPQGIFYSNNDGSLRSLTISYKVEYAVSGTNNWQTLTVPRQTHNIVTFHQDGTIATYPAWVVIPSDGSYSSGIVYSTDSDPGAHYPGEPWSGTQKVTYYNPDGSHQDGPIYLQGEWQPCDPNLNHRPRTSLCH